MRTTKILVPESWHDITLAQFAAYYEYARTRMATSTNTEIMVRTVEYFTDLTYDEIMRMKTSDMIAMYKDIDRVLNSPRPTEVQPIISLGGVLYGFHPDLSKMTNSEGIDLENLIEQEDGTIDPWPNITQIIAILYRPVTSIRTRKYKLWRLEFGKKMLKYSIEPYELKHHDNHELFKQLPMSVVHAMQVFFCDLGRAIQLTTQHYSTSDNNRRAKRRRRSKRVR